MRGYVSCVMGCPYQGEVPLETVRHVASSLYSMGCHEISLGDTIGIGTPEQTNAMITAVSADVPLDRIAVHFHDTYKRALVNILTALDCGVSVVDSSVASLGGCPYAEGATGNVSTEDVVYMLTELGIKTGVDLEALSKVANWICGEMERQNKSLYNINY